MKIKFQIWNITHLVRHFGCVGEGFLDEISIELVD